MITVKDLQEKLEEFPKDEEILIAPIRQSNGYYKLKDVGKMKVQDPSNGSESICPVLVF